jgi:outer membrane protein assembly factor BamB
MSVSRTALIATALCAFAANASSVQAQTIAALADGNKIVWIDAGKKKVVGSVSLAGNARLLGIDVRPKDGMVYGLTADGAIVSVDHKTGKWKKTADLSEKLPAGATFTVDFNPVADRMRILGSDGTSLRVNVEDGKAAVDGRLKYADADGMAGKMPSVVAGAYTNSIPGAKETTLYDIDAAAGTLVRQAPPNDGILNTIGKLGVKISGPVAFDVLSDGNGANRGWMVSSGMLYSVDLASGVAKMAGKIDGLKGRISDIAILAE